MQLISIFGGGELPARGRRVASGLPRLVDDGTGVEERIRCVRSLAYARVRLIVRAWERGQALADWNAARKRSFFTPLVLSAFASAARVRDAGAALVIADEAVQALAPAALRRRAMNACAGDAEAAGHGRSQVIPSPARSESERGDDDEPQRKLAHGARPSNVRARANPAS